MTPRGKTRTDDAGEVILAEAAAWLARLQGERTPATDAAFRAWMQDPNHARAFSRATDVWEILPGAMSGRDPAVVVTGRARRRWLAGGLVAAAVAIAALGVGVQILGHPVYRTAVGQQQTATLSDGTRVILNTDSRLVVDYSKAERRVRLERGEAMFEVTKNPRRPFIVQTDDEAVRALGTTFVVRKDGPKVSVVLVEGRVEVTRKVGLAKVTRVAVLSPGERLTVRPDVGAAVDRPKVETATAWRRGELMFEDSALIDAAAEINRYGGERVSVGDPSLAGLRVSGVFQTSNPREFAEAVAQLNHLRVAETSDGLVLIR